jgi:hypothetical protein
MAQPRQGVKLAVVPVVGKPEPQDDDILIPVKQYLNALVTRSEDRAARQEVSQIAELHVQILRLKDKISRMEDMIEDELKMWKRGIRDGDWETGEQVKRRMSRLNGALEYIGNEDSWRVRR